MQQTCREIELFWYNPLIAHGTTFLTRCFENNWTTKCNFKRIVVCDKMIEFRHNKSVLLGHADIENTDVFILMKMLCIFSLVEKTRKWKYNATKTITTMWWLFITEQHITSFFAMSNIISVSINCYFHLCLCM